MGIFVPQATERRDAFPYPVIPPNSATGQVSMRRVNLSRADAAMQKVAIFAAVDLIASTAAMLPLNVYSGTGLAKQSRPTPSWLMDLGGTGHGTSDFLWQALYCACLRGNVVGRIVDRSPQTGQPTTIDLAHPDDVDVTVDQNEQKPQWRIHGKTVPTGEIWHRRVYPVPGRVLGLSPIASHAITVSQGMYAQNFSAQWFADGAHPSSVLTNDKAGEITQAEARTVKERFMAAVRGTREPVVLGGGWNYQQIQISPGESQFLETQAYTATECARIYGPGMPEILGYATGGSMTYANIEQRSVDLLKYTLDRWLTRAERWLSELLPNPQYVRFDRNALLRTDALTRYQKHQLALKNGINTINGIRTTEEDLPPVPWGDEPYLPAMGSSAAAAALNDGTDPTTGVTDPGATGGQQTP